jgi:hypothetical protein
MNDIIEFDKIEITKTGLTIKGDLTEQEWFNALKYCNGIAGRIQWAVADLILYGEKKKYRKYEELLNNTDYSLGSLKNIKSVAERVSRRHDDLSFSHHAEVADLKPKDQEKFLNKASTEKLSVRELREEIHGKKEIQSAPCEKDECANCKWRKMGLKLQEKEEKKTAKQPDNMDQYKLYVDAFDETYFGINRIKYDYDKKDFGIIKNSVMPKVPLELWQSILKYLLEKKTAGINKREEFDLFRICEKITPLKVYNERNFIINKMTIKQPKKIEFEADAKKWRGEA